MWLATEEVTSSLVVKVHCSSNLKTCFNVLIYGIGYYQVQNLIHFLSLEHLSQPSENGLARLSACPSFNSYLVVVHPWAAISSTKVHPQVAFSVATTIAGAGIPIDSVAGTSCRADHAKALADQYPPLSLDAVCASLDTV